MPLSRAEQAICRICFGEEQEDDKNLALISPCKCEGSQKYIHVSCLRKWQRTVQLAGSNHPEDHDAEDRHSVCNVCKGTFDLPPQERGEMMSDLAGVSANRVRPGMLLVTKRSSESSASSIDNIAIRAFIEAKAAHFRRAVYILTEITPGASDGSDIVLGVNLCRTLETPNMEGLHCDVTGELLQQLQRDGVDVLWMNGGPVKPRHVCAMTLLHHTAVPSKGPSTLIAGDSGRVIYGSLEAVLSLAQEEAEAVRKAVTVLAWAGYAQWSRTQLLGEMARGSWGWSDATTKDVQDAATGAGVALWEELKHHSERLQWAPSNELSRDFEQRFATAPRAENDNQVEVVSALVQQFETMRSKLRV